MPRMLRHAAVLGATAHVASRRGQAKAEAAQQQEAAAAPPPPVGCQKSACLVSCGDALGVSRTA